jgi:hypothetical protein
VDIAWSSRSIIAASCLGVFPSSKMTTIAIKTSPTNMATMATKSAQSILLSSHNLTALEPITAVPAKQGTYRLGP